MDLFRFFSESVRMQDLGKQMRVSYIEVVCVPSNNTGNESTQKALLKANSNTYKCLYWVHNTIVEHWVNSKNTVRILMYMYV